MRYFITKMGYPDVVEIDMTEYNEIKVAKKNLFEALFLEEKLDLVTENFHEYEAELLSTASKMMIFHDHDYFSGQHHINLLSRRIANLMSACRMYLHQSLHHIGNIYGKASNEIEMVKTEQAFHYDQSLAYRVMEALRNYVQHRGFPINTVKWVHRAVGEGDNSQLLNTIVPMVKLSALSEDKKFKRSVLKELKSINNEDKFDIRPMIRDYVDRIGSMHEKIRELIKPDLIQWEDLLNNVIHKFYKEFGSDVSVTGLVIVIAKDENSRWAEHEQIFYKFVEHRKALEKKNRFFNDLHKSYASNEIRE